MSDKQTFYKIKIFFLQKTIDRITHKEYNTNRVRITHENWKEGNNAKK